ncbi:MAG: FliM/FliN family flagellar motor C-terminal domain-containing protein [Sphingopyxis sp.]
MKERKSNKGAQGDDGSAMSGYTAVAQRIPDSSGQNLLPAFCSGAALKKSNDSPELFQSASEAIAKNIKSAFEIIAKYKMHIENIGASIKQDNDGKNCNDNDHICFNYNINPLGICIHIHLSEIVMSRMLDLYYGGDGLHSDIIKFSKTSTAMTLFIEQIDKIVKNIINNVWSNHSPVDIEISQRALTSCPEIFPDYEMCYCYDYIMSRGEIFSDEMEIINVAGSKTNLQLGINDDNIKSIDINNNIWSEELMNSIKTISFKARAILCKFDISINDLMKLQRGDIISINNNRSAQLIIGNQILAFGHIGEKSGLSAFKIHQLEDNRHG